jgi:hypothetical protein
MIYVVLLGIRAFRYMRFSVEALFGIGAFGYTRLWVRKPLLVGKKIGHFLAPIFTPSMHKQNLKS